MGRRFRLIAAAVLATTAAAMGADAPGPFPPARPPRVGDPPPPGDDPFQKLTSWRGTTSLSQVYKFVITERDGERFKGFMQEVPDKPVKANPFGPSGPPRIVVEGTVRNGELAFRQAGANNRVELTYSGRYQNGKLKLASTARPAAPMPRPGAPPSPRKVGPRPAPPPPVTATAEFTFHEMYYASFQDINELYEPLTADDPRAAARELARLMSFTLYLPGSTRRYPISDRLWLPYRSMRLTREGSTGFPEAEAATRHRLAELAGRAPGALRPAAQDARAILTARLKVARFNQEHGNTPDASLTRDFPNFFGGMLDALGDLNRQLKLDEDAQRRLPSADTLRAAARFGYSGSRERINDLLTKERQAWDKGGDRNALPPPVQVTRLMTNADALLAHAQADFWARHLVPALDAAAYPPAAGPLVRVDPTWAAFDKGEAQGLSGLAYKNVSGRPLTNVVLELRLENEYGERTALYHYVEHWAADAVLRALPHPAWGNQRTYHMARFAGHLAAWADQGKAARQNVELVNPRLSPRAKQLRQEWLDMEASTEVWTRFLGLAVIEKFPLPPVTRP